MWERRPGGRGPCLSLVSQSPKPFYPEGARTDTRNPVWPSCLPCGRITGIHPVSQSPPPPSPGPQAPASCRVTAIWMSTWAELEGPPGAAGARGLGQAGGVRGQGGCVCRWRYLGEQAECRSLGEVPPRGALLAVPAVCPHSGPPTMAPLFPAARQFGGGS